MADDKAKKTKIDLKARLGRAQGTQPPGSLPLAQVPMGGSPPPPPPPPSSSSGLGTGLGSVPAPPPSTAPPMGSRPPMGIAPPPGISPGIPMPPFAPPPRPSQAAAAPKPTAVAQTIKVEVGEEIHEERKKARNRAMITALVGAVIGIGIGFTAGQAAEVGNRAKSAAKGAAILDKDVKAANDKLRELDTKLSEASDKLKNKQFPEDLAASLSGITIPFDATNLNNKGVNGMPSALFRTVLNYTSACENVNKLRESLRNLVGFTKDPIVKAWKEETAPVAAYSVVFRGDSKNIVADLFPIAAPGFPWKGDHPEKFKVTKADGKPSEVSRWVKGDLSNAAIPVDPKTTAAFTSDVMIGRLNKAIYDLRVELQGNKENPTTETPGLLKVGEDLDNELRKYSSQNQ